jgi:cytochrome P450
VLRFDAPNQALVRFAERDVVIGGERISAGAKVILFAGAANRDPSHHEDSDVFRPHRTPVRTLSFGLDAHYCLGAQLATAKAEIGLSTLIRHHPRMVLDGQPFNGNQLVQRDLARMEVRLDGA